MSDYCHRQPDGRREAFLVLACGNAPNRSSGCPKDGKKHTGEDGEQEGRKGGTKQGKNMGYWGFCSLAPRGYSAIV